MNTHIEHLVTVAAGIVLAIALYLLPAFIATRKRNHRAILAATLLTGWTGIGWVVCLVWSLTKDAK